MQFTKAFDLQMARTVRNAFLSLKELLPVRFMDEDAGGSHYLSLILPAHENNDRQAVHFKGTSALYKALFAMLEEEGIARKTDIATSQRDDYDERPVKALPIVLATTDERCIDAVFTKIAARLSKQFKKLEESHDTLSRFIGAEPKPHFFHDEPLLGRHLIALSLDKTNAHPFARLSEKGEAQKSLLSALAKSGAIEVEAQDGCYVASIRDGKKLEQMIAELNRKHPPAQPSGQGHAR